MAEVSGSNLPNLHAHPLHQRMRRQFNPSMPCPCCNAASKVRTSKFMSHTVRELYYDCTDPECNHGFKCVLAFVETIRASLKGPVRQTEPSLRLKTPP
jgi:hypothetical protein